MKTETYKLYVGFRKLGEFNSIWQAKQFARDSGLSGTFSLIGDGYRDSWYEVKKELKSEI